MIKTFYLFILFTFAFYCNSGAQISIDGEIRPRTEYRQGFRKPLADSLSPSFLTLQRTRFSAEYKSESLEAKICLQDSRIWGKSDTKMSDSKIEIYEAWAELFFNPRLNLRLGRQPLKYDDQRLLGSAQNWSNTGLAHDLVLIKYSSPSKFQVHAGAAFNNSKDTLMDVAYTTKQMYKTMGFFWLSKEFTNSWNITTVAISEGLQKQSEDLPVYLRFTCGGNLNYFNDSSKFGLNATAYYQLGKNLYFADLEAYLLAIKISYKFYKTQCAVLGFEYYSGSKYDLSQDVSHTFSKLYGVNHSFNGFMEYWASLPKSGLKDYYLGLKGKINSKLSLDLYFHYFEFAQKFIKKNDFLNSHVGSELDVVMNYNLKQEIAFQAGYCAFINSSSTNEYFGITEAKPFPSQWIYIMTTIKLNFFKSSIKKQS